MPSNGTDFLLDRINYERRSVLPYNPQRMKLANMRELLRRLENPDEQFPIVHVAGTKGKGSVTAMLSSIGSAANLKVGTYTSPHLASLTERFCIKGQQCSEEQLEQLIASIRPHVIAMDELADKLDKSDSSRAELTPVDRPTFFEITTAIAFQFFANQNVDLAVIETGLGGRLDSTNVCNPVLSVITSISFDHTKQLGETLGEIAFEKAGIIKPKVSVVSGVERVSHGEVSCSQESDWAKKDVTKQSAAEVIRDVATANDSALLQLGNHFSISPSQKSESPPNQTTAFELPKSQPFDFVQNEGATLFRFERVNCGLIGRHQQRNAAVAIAAARQLSSQFPNINEETIRQGIRNVSLPGRIELVNERPPVVCDVAHNVASSQALIETIGDAIADFESILIFATSRDKDFEGSLRVLLPRFDRVIFTRFVDNPRARSPEQLLASARAIAKEKQMQAFDSPIAAWNAAQSMATDRCVICVTGSAFIVAELRTICGDK